ncbi:S8 family serine peptidase [Deinococcus aerophilus]|uniref:Serine protease n=1 Tax=Deinococcus aerophilus TaxID=522488 RepID=A0ABQ2GNF1_9DEIO|nr:S8 family serine peptidase [Deinococcus aerophilus]GGM03704.1 serine protease [Deinococcus aerophilus]
MTRRALSLLTLPLLCAAALTVEGSAVKPGDIPALPPGQAAPVPAPATPPPAAPTPLPEIAPAPPTPAQPTPPLLPRTPAPARPGLSQPPAAPAAYRPRDPLYPRQWDMAAIGAPEAWAQLPGGPARAAPVTVAVIDTGYVNSPELTGRVTNGYDFVSDPARAGDGDGRDADASGLGPFAYHAETIANIIAAAHDGRGMAGLNPAARIVQVRVAGVDGLIDPHDLADGLRWAAGLSVPGVPANPRPAKILNLSLFADFIPLTGCDARIQKAVDDVTARGALVIAGAANDGADSRGYSPAGCRNVLTVTSVTREGTRPGYANWGRAVSLAAPGGEADHGVVVSSLSGPGGERTPNGTSFAAPHASGVASLLLSVRPKLSPAALSSTLTRSATPFPAGRCDPDPARTCGSGTLNAGAALRATLASAAGK